MATLRSYASKGLEESAPRDEERVCPACGGAFPADFVVCPHDGSALGVAANEGDPLVGTVLASSYRIERAIARGGMGRLYEATHTRLPRSVAVKVLHEPHALKKDAVRRFEREASALSRIDSPHVVPVLDFARTVDGRSAIVTPLLEGEDLQSLLEVGPVDARQAAVIALQVCRGLAAAHRVGIVHRDLKPSNLFVESPAPGQLLVRILDFGVAKLGEEDMTRTGVVLGTPAYMAPEQAGGASHVDARADVYGVGAVLYRMLAGKAPYEGRDAANTLTKVLSGGPAALVRSARVPASLATIVERAMSRDPDERYPSADRMAADLEAFLAAPRRASAPVRPLRASRGRASLATVLAGLVLTLLAWAVVTSVAAWAAPTSEQGVALALAARSVATAFVCVGFAYVGQLEVRSRWNSQVALESWWTRVRDAAVGALAVLGAQVLMPWTSGTVGMVLVLSLSTAWAVARLRRVDVPAVS